MRTVAARSSLSSSAAILILAFALPLSASGRSSKHDTGNIDPGPQPAPFSPDQKIGAVPCFGGQAAGYPCAGVDLLSFTPRAEMGSNSAEKVADLWGWHDRQTGMELALVAMERGTSFVDVTQPSSPRVLGYLPSTGGFFPNREVNVYADHAYIVADGPDQHGLQVFDLRQLRGYDGPPQQLTETARYTEFENCHNFNINPDSGFGYAVGTNTCGAGLHMVDLRDPQSPKFAGCYQDPEHGYIHDVQCVIYKGPDRRFNRHEICFASNETALLIVDVTDKAKPVRLARKSYEGVGYTHQAWLTEDQKFLLLDDELDEIFGESNTRTYLWNLAKLTDPRHFSTYVGPTIATDHNQFVKGKLLYQANYRAGLRILDLAKVAKGELSETGYFDIVPDSDNPGFDGAWGVYPWLPSGNLIVSGISQGLYVLRSAGPGALPATCRPSADRLCLGGNRYQVEGSWQESNGGSGRATARKGTGGTGYFSFSRPEELEVAFRVSNGGGVAFASLTDRPFFLQVADLKTRRITVLRNGESFCAGAGRLAKGAPVDAESILAAPATGLGDAAPALPRPYRLDLGLVPASERKHEGSCRPSADTVCLHEKALQVKLSYLDPANGTRKTARAVALTDGTGGFAFRSPQEPEVLVKAFERDGHLQLVWGGFTSAAYRLEVENTLDGTTKSYDKEAGDACGGRDAEAFAVGGE